MQVVVLADEEGREALKAKKTGEGVQLIFAENFNALADHGTADAFFLLKEEIPSFTHPVFNSKPVCVHSTTGTLKKLQLPGNYCRINAWPTFLQRPVWEVAAGNEALIKDLFVNLEWQYILVEDVPGLVAARVIAMIINEAYFALGEAVSGKDEIDLAMKLGTNYPYGPFEWSRKIGLEKIDALLEKLSESDNRYAVAPAMKNELLNTQWHSS